MMRPTVSCCKYGQLGSQNVLTEQAQEIDREVLEYTSWRSSNCPPTELENAGMKKKDCCVARPYGI